MSHPTFYMATNPARSNAHGIGYRDESWVLRQGPSFGSEEEAKEYVERLSRNQTILPTLLVDLPAGDVEARRRVVDEFCFGNSPRYTAHRRYFLHKPCAEEIVGALEREGIRVIHDKNLRQMR